jgi:hypothetical protein
MFRRAGIKLPSESASTYYMRMGFRLRFRYTSTPQRGDVVFYNFSHVGILESFTATTVTCIEGNTSSGAGSQSNGGGVFRRTRSRSLVLGYGRPAYTAVPSTPPPAPTPPPGVVMVNAPLVSVLSHPRGGYVEVCADGGVFTFGGAPFYGSAGAIRLNKPIVGAALTPSGNGYWLVAADGGIFNFGDAVFHGSAGATVLNKPIIGMSVTGTGLGYRLYASDGGVFCYGDARFDGTVQFAG